LIKGEPRLDDLPGAKGQRASLGHGQRPLQHVDDVRVGPGGVVGQRAAIDQQAVDGVAHQGDATDGGAGVQVHGYWLAEPVDNVVLEGVAGQCRITVLDAQTVAGVVAKDTVGQGEGSAVIVQGTSAIIAEADVDVIQDIAGAAAGQLDPAP